MARSLTYMAAKISLAFLSVSVTSLSHTQLLKITMRILGGAYLKIFWANMVK